MDVSLVPINFCVNVSFISLKKKMKRLMGTEAKQQIYLFLHPVALRQISLVHAKIKQIHLLRFRFVLLFVSLWWSAFWNHSHNIEICVCVWGVYGGWVWVCVFLCEVFRRPSVRGTAMGKTLTCKGSTLVDRGTFITRKQSHDKATHLSENNS